MKVAAGRTVTIWINSAMLPPTRTYQAIVYPAQCDAMGHMSVQYYVAAFDQAMWALVYALGWRPDPDSDSRGFADVKHVVRYLRELRAGAPFAIDSHVADCGASSLVTNHKMIDVTTGELAAEAEMTSVHFDLIARKSTPLPDAFRSKLAAITSSGTAENARSSE